MVMDSQLVFTVFKYRKGFSKEMWRAILVFWKKVKANRDVGVVLRRQSQL
jgi:hypothetical protein